MALSVQPDDSFCPLPFQPDGFIFNLFNQMIHVSFLPQKDDYGKPIQTDFLYPAKSHGPGIDSLSSYGVSVSSGTPRIPRKHLKLCLDQQFKHC